MHKHTFFIVDDYGFIVTTIVSTPTYMDADEYAANYITPLLPKLCEVHSADALYYDVEYVPFAHID